MLLSEVMNKDSVDQKEIKKFSNNSHHWWNLNGKFKTLHQINDLRFSFITNKIESYFEGNNVDILDVGCGGGILTESLHKYGYKVIGIDPSGPNIEAAKAHNSEIEYINCNIECFQEKKFDVVISLEVIEHVSSIPIFVEQLAKCIKPNGLLFISTINRTISSFVKAIICGEYILKLLPKGTHEWGKMVKPSETESHMLKNNIVLREITGMTFNPLIGKWHLNKKDISVNYICYGQKICFNK